MRYLIYGAGTIGLTYAHLLAVHHDVDVLVLPERSEEVSRACGPSLWNTVKS